MAVKLWENCWTSTILKVKQKKTVYNIHLQILRALEKMLLMVALQDEWLAEAYDLVSSQVSNLIINIKVFKGLYFHFLWVSDSASSNLL